MKVTIEGTPKQIRSAARTIADGPPKRRHILKAESERIASRRRVVHRAFLLTRDDTLGSRAFLDALTGRAEVTDSLVLAAEAVVAQQEGHHGKTVEC